MNVIKPHGWDIKSSVWESNGTYTIRVGWWVIPDSTWLKMIIYTIVLLRRMYQTSLWRKHIQIIHTYVAKNNGPNGHSFYVGGDLMMRRGMLPIIMLAGGDLCIVLHLVPFWFLTIWGSVRINLECNPSQYLRLTFGCTLYIAVGKSWGYVYGNWQYKVYSVSGLATDSPCGVWGRGWTTCLLHDSPLFGSHFKMRVGM